ncbi:methylenetetrahydrofolate dehydrogenase (NADP+) / methenyltetrahydrofolate cyclohydrolase [Nitratiruptor sp. YY08-26]|uniref:bifunctional methylenetetrahydrofolate dehydrogenase/methenyltetrahydrofolate cyclohydrolase FolD n=1 Tax=unclassified Nitratiruptor TaxID=2624044 RepID=UPI001915B664|nr:MULTISPECIES: bifunctional methylenetetrahydrofolate dehydrogenase/methenyltetrahydrofolate cyclohydrolase FolD [unclassified Nitratiruptor]BCD62027.1 methylenetetrahydrofolate dehydrogenase (NADP+) / methenyltetrahydrofolate cyclohydrolase [Nitratiruptor sp. YY08-13]BCD65963.1 methylenetetrahydrofolate dehydrogenase (NADP+) / methenyltetrahydrofolate cyclohydrolase [Nitratiruptor sp. YY08-26]
MQILDGKKLSQKIKEQIKSEVAELKEKYAITPGLAVILVGDDPASHTYVKMKAKACKEVGFYSIVHEMPESITQEKIEETIKLMNQNPNIDGILVQLPLPIHIDATRILELIEPAKDVDGFHPYNFGRLMQGLDTFAPCTPLGVIELLHEYNIDPKGLDVCVVGASNIVGKPMAALLLNAFATVDICHIYTKDLQSHTKRADMVVVGVGKAGLITADMVKDGAIVIDIGINKVDGKIVGDVDFEEVSKKASYITPVPGGVGPMTIAMLLQNTLKAAKKRIQS